MRPAVLLVPRYNCRRCCMCINIFRTHGHTPKLARQNAALKGPPWWDHLVRRHVGQKASVARVVRNGVSDTLEVAPQLVRAPRDGATQQYGCVAVRVVCDRKDVTAALPSSTCGPDSHSPCLSPPDFSRMRC